MKVFLLLGALLAILGVAAAPVRAQTQTSTTTSAGVSAQTGASASPMASASPTATASPSATAAATAAATTSPKATRGTSREESTTPKPKASGTPGSTKSHTELQRMDESSAAEVTPKEETRKAPHRNYELGTQPSTTPKTTQEQE